MEGAQRLALKSGARFISGATLDLNFIRGQCLVGNTAKTLSDIDAYHTRSSTAYAQLLDGSYEEYPIDTARIISGTGYQCEPAATNLSANGLNMFNAASLSGATKSPYGSAVAGFPSPVVVASDGLYWHRLSDVFLHDFEIGDTARIQLVVKLGTSEKYYIEFRNIDEGLGASLEGDATSTTNLSTNTGTFTEITSTALGDDVFHISCLFTCSVAGSSWQLGAGPNSTVVGETLIIAAQDIKVSSSLSSITDGARTADKLILPAEDLPSDFSEGFAFIKWKEENYDHVYEAGYLKLGRLQIDNDNRIDFVRTPATGNIAISLKREGTNVFNYSASKPAVGSINTIGITWGNGAGIISLNGNEVSGTFSDLPSVGGKFSVGCNTYGLESINAEIHRAVLGNIKPSDAKFSAMYAEIAS